MKGSETKLVKFMSGDDKRFVIPVYQRNYDWKIEHCRQLFDDLVKIVKQNRKSHFFGSIVCVYDDDGLDEEYLIIDGQQRLTTISLLLLAMHNLLEQDLVEATDLDLKDKIYKKYLVDEYKKDDTKVKLKPIKNDSLAYNKLFDSKEYHLQNSNVTINYNYFYNRILKNEVKIDDLFSAICKLEIIHIKLNTDDNPQLIFESLNSTGLDLTEGDKIRNYVLMGLPSKQQEEFYLKYWNKIEQNTNYDASMFVRDYLSMKTKSIPAMHKIYVIFKNYTEENNLEVENLLKDLLKFSEFYKRLVFANTNNTELDNCIYRLNRLETTVARPFFMQVLNLHEDNVLTIDDVLNIFLITESFVFRRNICDLPTNILNKLFLLIHKEIVNLDDTLENYVEKYKYCLLSKKEKSRFPRNEEFINSLEAKNIYQMNSKNKLYLFERFENYDTSETKNIWIHFDNGDYSIEHIMPQHLTPAWALELGEDYEMIHETWLHRLANLTITAYNSKYSNNTFIEKKTMKNGYIESGLRINQLLSHFDKWSLKEIELRNESMKTKAMEIWSLPETSYFAKEKEFESLTLDDDISLSGRQLSKFSFRGIERPVNSWIEMYTSVLKMLHNEDKSILTRLAYIEDESVELSAHFKNNQNGFENSEEIDENLFVWKGTSTNYKMSLLRKIFKLFNADPEDLVLYLENEEKNDDIQKEDCKRRYWTYAIEYVKKENIDNGSFSKVTTSGVNWLSGYIGYSGFSINLVANNENARVDFYISTNDVDKNKAIFDTFNKRKDEIEAKLGTQLVWRRGDDTKSSSIMIVLNNVSIKNEDDWHEMAIWHAEWSKKFNDILVPILDEFFSGVETNYEK